MDVRAAVLPLLLCCALYAGAAAADGGLRSSVVLSVAADAMASAFELKDQYNTSYDYKFPKSKVSVLAFGDRKGSKQIEGWILPLHERYGNRVDIHGIAELSAVPSLARGVARRIIKREVKYPVMLDWEGTVSRSYGFKSGQANIIVIDRNGRIILKMTGAANSFGLNQIYSQIDRQL